VNVPRGGCPASAAPSPLGGGTGGPVESDPWPLGCPSLSRSAPLLWGFSFVATMQLVCEAGAGSGGRSGVPSCGDRSCARSSRVTVSCSPRSSGVGTRRDGKRGDGLVSTIWRMRCVRRFVCARHAQARARPPVPASRVLRCAGLVPQAFSHAVASASLRPSLRM